jgi:hypothetical protein
MNCDRGVCVNSLGFVAQRPQRALEPGLTSLPASLAEADFADAYRRLAEKRRLTVQLDRIATHVRLRQDKFRCPRRAEVAAVRILFDALLLPT